jgi:hypothetical protein
VVGISEKCPLSWEEKSNVRLKDQPADVDVNKWFERYVSSNYKNPTFEGWRKTPPCPGEFPVDFVDIPRSTLRGKDGRTLCIHITITSSCDNCDNQKKELYLKQVMKPKADADPDPWTFEIVKGACP